MKPVKISGSRAALVAGILVIAAAAALTISGCSQDPMAEARDDGGNQPQAASGHAVRVETVGVEQHNLVNTVEMPGTIKAFESTDLMAKVGGFLRDGFTIHSQTGLQIDIGDYVYKDQVLARLWIPEMEKELQQKLAAVAQAEAEIAQAEAAVEQASANLESARATVEEKTTERAEKQADLDYAATELKRYEQLVASNAARRDLLDRAKAQFEAAAAAMNSVEARIKTAGAQLTAAQAGLSKARADRKAAEARRDVAQADVDYVRTKMEYAEIKAPFDGEVIDRTADTGDFIQPAEGNSAAKPLLTIQRIKPVRVSLVVPMKKVRYLEVGDRAVLRHVDVLPGEEFPGKVTRVNPALNESSRLMRVEIDLKNEDGRLRPGYYGLMTVYLQELQDTPVVPSSALLTADSETYVYVVAGGVCRRRPVRVVFQDGTIVGVASGDLQPGEQVVRSGGGQLHDGDKVATQVAAN